MITNFTEWFDKVCSNLKREKVLAEIDNGFKGLKTDHERISLLSKYGSSFTNVSINESYNCKSNKTSEEYRKKGNEFYKKNKLDDALTAYSKSISFAINKSIELGLAYANRSAVLISLQEPVLCNYDITLAFKNSYPSNLYYKLYERRSKCFEITENNDEALKSIEESIKSLEVANANQNKKEGLKKRLAKSLKNLKERDVLSIKQNYLPFKNVMYCNSIPKLPTINKFYPSCTESFKIMKDETRGRYAAAAKKILPGEIIVIDKPFASISIPSSFDTHCYNCLDRFKVLYPCRLCASISYCSIECEQQSWQDYHKYECKYMNYLILDDIGLGHLALKMVSKLGLAALENFQKHHISFQNEIGLNKEENGFNEKGVFESKDYHCVYSLVGNSEKRKPSDLFRRSLISIFLCNILKNTGYFNTSIECDYQSHNVLVSTHLLKQIQMLPCNAHEVSELQLKDTEIANAELKEIGSAVYTTLSLLNHSCDPSVVRHCYGDTCVLRAIKHIDIGEEIVDNYGFLYPVEDKESRIQHLNEQYYFTCQCLPCTSNWPLYNDIPDELPNFKCIKCNMLFKHGLNVCSTCQNIDKEVKSFTTMHSNFQSCMKNVLKDGIIKGNLETLLEYLNFISSRAELPTIHLNNCQEIVKLCFSLQANFVKL